MWFQLLVIALAIIVILLLIQGTTERSLRSGRHRVWIPADRGRYYMAALGVTKETAQQFITDALQQDKSGLVTTPQDVSAAAEVLAVGTVVFYFRAEGDARPLAGNEAVFLAPIGDIEELTVVDTFQLQPDGSLIIPAHNSKPVMVCTDPTGKCTPGSLGFGGEMAGTRLQVELVKTYEEGWDVRLMQYGTTGKYLGVGPTLCPYAAANASASASAKTAMALRCQSLPGQRGGPRIPRIGTGHGDIFRLQVV